MKRSVDGQPQVVEDVILRNTTKYPFCTCQNPNSREVCVSCKTPPMSKTNTRNEMDPSAADGKIVEVIDLTALPATVFPKTKRLRRSSLQDKEMQTDQSVQTIEIKNAEENTHAKGKGKGKATIKAIKEMCRKLEQAIFDGDEDSAAETARLLAHSNVACIIYGPIKKPPIKQTRNVTVQVFVIGEGAYEGPTPLKVRRDMTIAELKVAAFKALKIPVAAQRWTINDQFASDDEQRLSVYNIDDFVKPLFLSAYTNGTSKENVNTPEEPAEPNFQIMNEYLPVCKDNIPGTSFANGQHKKDYGELNNLINQEVITNVVEFKCTICNRNCAPGTCLILNDCLHTFCMECLHLAITTWVKCPQVSCHGIFQQKELKAIVNNATYDKFSFKLQTIPANKVKTIVMFNCKTPDFTGQGVYLFLCPICNRVNCLICMATHNGINSRPSTHNGRQYQEQLMYETERHDTGLQKNIEEKISTSGIPAVSADNIPSTSSSGVSEMKGHYNELMNLDTQDVVENIEGFRCIICSRDFAPQTGVILRDCLHTFCRDCLCNTIKLCNAAEVKCPYVDDQYSCCSVLQQREIKAIVDEETYEQHLNKSLLIAENELEYLFYCKTPACAGRCFYENGVNNFQCPDCKVFNCLTCQAIHTGISCSQYQEKLENETGRQEAPLQANLREIPVADVIPGNSRSSVTNTGHYDELINLGNQALVKNVSEFECPICFTNCPREVGVILGDCLHAFCKECLRNTISFCEEAEVKCPFMDNQYSCESLLREREIKALVDEEVYEKHLAKSISVAESKLENTFHCKTPNCTGWCIYEDEVNVFECPVCKAFNCLTCQAIHSGLNCKQYQEHLKHGSGDASELQTKEMMQKLITEDKAMKCPSCLVVIMKKSGCDWLKCTMCKTEICWATRGPRWGPRGPGDVSGGCQCKTWRRCHPKCNNCH